MLVLILFAFLAGIVTTLSPCILPVLPIVLSGSLGGGKWRPLGVVAGFIASFTFFTLFLSLIVQALGISADALRTFSIIVIGGFGLSLLLPQFQALLERLFSNFAQFVPQQQGSGFGGGFLLGLSIGLLWTPCVGPILAAVISLALTGTVTSTAIFVTLAYSIGTAIPMLTIVHSGRALLERVPWLVSNTKKIQQIFGLIMILMAVVIFFNFDRKFQTWILTTFPNYGTGLTQFEENGVIKKALDAFRNQSSTATLDTTTQMKGKPSFVAEDQMNYPLAPEITGGTNWVNAQPLTLQDLRGKVVLVDFWTYSCINCIRTLPYLKDWYTKYKDDGFVIVGVHAPEFEFEKDTDNVKMALQDFAIEYPVVQDNNFTIWNAYNNHYWPAKYLIDKNGRIRYTHFGEGEYLETENKIRELLDETSLSAQEATDFGTQPKQRPLTPETYLGYQRAGSYVQPVFPGEAHTYAAQIPQELHGVSLEGSWQMDSEFIQAQQAAAKVRLRFEAEHVYLVMAPQASGSGEVRVLLDGQPLPEKYQTQDMVMPGVIPVNQARKYDLVDLGNDYGEHLIEIEFTQGVEAFAFTFG